MAVTILFLSDFVILFLSDLVVSLATLAFGGEQ
jgi:hypothetical protein